MRRIYMDANATTPLLPEVVEAMRPFWIEQFGNPSSVHQQGQQARAAVDRARESVARLLNCRATEIVFTSGGTESDNLALFGVLQPMLQAAERPHLITTATEHHAVLHAAQALAERGAEVTFLPPTADGLIEPEALSQALQPNTKLVSILFANNETGVIQPIAELAAIAHAAGALFHTDAIQAAGKLPLDLAGALHNVDLLSLSGHKMYAPQGTGVLFVRRKTALASLFFGGAHERQRRPGTENVPGIVASVWQRSCSSAVQLDPEMHLDPAPRPPRTRPTRPNPTIRRQRLPQPPRPQHRQPLLRWHRRRFPRHRARSEGSQHQRRLSLSVRSDRALPRSHRHGPPACPCEGKRPHLPLPPQHRGRHRHRTRSDSRRRLRLRALS